MSVWSDANKLLFVSHIESAWLPLARRPPSSFLIKGPNNLPVFVLNRKWMRRCERKVKEMTRCVDLEWWAVPYGASRVAQNLLVGENFPTIPTLHLVGKKSTGEIPDHHSSVINQRFSERVGASTIHFFNKMHKTRPSFCFSSTFSHSHKHQNNRNRQVLKQCRQPNWSST